MIPLFNTPLALQLDRAEELAAWDLATRFRLTAPGLPAAREPKALADDLGADTDNRFFTVIGGAAVIPVRGDLMPGTGTWWGTGYGAIRQGLLSALAKPDVKAVAVDIRSYGGTVEGCFDLVDMIYAARGDKPIWAILSEFAYSAAYAVASACDRVIVPRTGGTGSIGVLNLHVDFTKALSEDGIKVSLIRFGARKAESNPYEALSEQARAKLQADVDQCGELFVETVARNRNVAASIIRKQNATTFMGAQGVENGLADAVMAPDEAFRALLASI